MMTMEGSAHRTGNVFQGIPHTYGVSDCAACGAVMASLEVSNTTTKTEYAAQVESQVKGKTTLWLTLSGTFGSVADAEDDLKQLMADYPYRCRIVRIVTTTTVLREEVPE